LNAIAAVVIAAIVAAIGYSSLVLIQNPFGTNMKFALVLVGFGEIAGVITSQVLIAKYAPKEVRGSVIGFFGFCGALGIMTAFGIGGYLFDHWRESGPFLLFGWEKLSPEDRLLTASEIKHKADIPCHYFSMQG
jgi:MFS family permease